MTNTILSEHSGDLELVPNRAKLPHRSTRFFFFLAVDKNFEHIRGIVLVERTSLVAQMVKASAYNAGDLGSIPVLGRFPWRRKWQPTPVLLPRKSHGQRSLVGYSPC